MIFERSLKLTHEVGPGFSVRGLFSSMLIGFLSAFFDEINKSDCTILSGYQSPI